VRAREIGEFITNLAPQREPGTDEGFLWGDPNAEVTGVVVTWMPTVEAVQRAISVGANLVITHEALTNPYPFRGQLEQALHWKSNQARLSRLAKGGITVFRAHGKLDEYNILDDFAAALGLPDPEVRDGFVRIHRIEPTPMQELARRASEAAGEKTIRVCGNLDGDAEVIGLPWGGLGLSLNAAFIERVVAYEPDVLIGGESDEYAMFMMLDCGTPFIETGHAGSENIGLQSVADDIAAEFPDLTVVFHELKRPWRTMTFE
jgi:putative NIF3 family GTP cyclohydrolase 1 type 2